MTVSVRLRARHRRWCAVLENGDAFSPDTKLVAAVYTRNNFLFFCRLDMLRFDFPKVVVPVPHQLF